MTSTRPSQSDMCSLSLRPVLSIRPCLARDDDYDDDDVDLNDEML